MQQKYAIRFAHTSHTARDIVIDLSKKNCKNYNNNFTKYLYFCTAQRESLIGHFFRAFTHKLTYGAFGASRDASSHSHRRRIGRELFVSGMLGVCAVNAPLNSFADSTAHLRCRAEFPTCNKGR